MFRRNSRYARAAVYTVITRDGVQHTAFRLPIRERPNNRGVHLRGDFQRLDAIAAHYLGDATAFWRLCDVADTIAPDALAEHHRIAIPEGER